MPSMFDSFFILAHLLILIFFYKKSKLIGFYLELNHQKTKFKDQNKKINFFAQSIHNNT
jgi:hypothetical protein